MRLVLFFQNITVEVEHGNKPLVKSVGMWKKTHRQKVLRKGVSVTTKLVPLLSAVTSTSVRNRLVLKESTKPAFDLQYKRNRLSSSVLQHAVTML